MSSTARNPSLPALMGYTVRLYAFQTSERASHIPEGRRYHPVLDEIAVLFSLSTRYRRVSGQPKSQLSVTRTNVTTKCRRHTQIKKRSYFAEMLDYLGHIIRPVRLKMEKEANTAIQELENQTTQTKVGSFLGLCYV